MYQARQKDKKDALLLRQQQRAERTAKQQLEVLDKRLGKGMGARKERARLLKQVSEAQA